MRDISNMVLRAYTHPTLGSVFVLLEGDGIQQYGSGDFWVNVSALSELFVQSSFMSDGTIANKLNQPTFKTEEEAIRYLCEKCNVEYQELI